MCECVRALSLPSERTVVVCVCVVREHSVYRLRGLLWCCECVRALSLPSERTVVVCVCVSTQFTVRESCCGVCVCVSTQFTV